MSEFKHKEYGSSLKVSKEDLPPGMSKIIKELQECTAHAMMNVLFNKRRRYRRGKNRCLRCGHLLITKEAK